MAINKYGLDEYESLRAGSLFYTQRKFGSEWFNEVDNKKGWTVDFNLRVVDVQNSDRLLDEESKVKGIGIYVNDGSNQEVVNFFTQEIIFSNANKTVIHDTTIENDYRLIGKNDSLKLFSKPDGEESFIEIAQIPFNTKATKNGNALKPSVFQDSNGILYATWWDDGNGIGSIYYSKYSDSMWSEPEEVISVKNGVRDPSIIVDNSGIVYIVYESMETEGSVIGFVYRNDIGWSDPYYTGIDIGSCRNPKAVFDSQSNVCIVWEDTRFIYPQIYVNTFLAGSLKWKGEEKLSDEDTGCHHPSIASYMDDIYVSWTRRGSDTSVIQIHKYSASNYQTLYEDTISEAAARPDHSSILTNVAGKIFVVWHDNISGGYKIYGAVYSPNLTVLEGPYNIVEGNGGSRYPVLSEHLVTGDIYLTWQDYKSGTYQEFDSFTSPSVDEEDPYYATSQSREPLNSSIYVAVYREGSFLSSGTSSFDVMLSFVDNRDVYFPITPPFFSGELPILYESYLSDEYNFVGDAKFMSQVRCAFYDLSRDGETFSVNYGVNDDETYGIDRDLLLNSNAYTKEIRFGDFSNVVNAHYVFKNFKYYTKDAIEPFSLKEIIASDFGLDSLNAVDVAVNNYGDIWIVGTCGAYYYVSNDDHVSMVKAEYGGIIDFGFDALENIKAISFNSHNTMFLGINNAVEGGVYFSYEHYKSFLPVGGVDKKVTALAFDHNDNMCVGTEENGVQIFAIDYVGDNFNITFTLIDTINTSSKMVTCIKVDANNVMWIGTTNGLYRYYNGKSMKLTTLNGLSSNRINDVAIRNTAIRYVATSNGVNKMVGLGVDKHIKSDESIWNNNVKSIMWKEPNVILAGTLTRINQILVDDVDDTYSTLFYAPSIVLSSDNNDLQNYYININEDNPIEETDILQVYINGNIVQYGYDWGYDKTTNNAKVLRFRIPLKHNDIVEVLVRKDLEEVSTFAQTEAEKLNMGGRLIQIKDFASHLYVSADGITESNLYVVTKGDEYEVKLNDSTSRLPFDKVHLDTHAPTFTDEDGNGMIIEEQIDRSLVRIGIVGATDTTDTDVGSGIDTMIVSNNDQFQDSTGNALTPIPFSNSVSHDLGLSLDNVVVEETFDSGSGSVIEYFSNVNELYAATSIPAVLYKYNWSDQDWEVLYSYEDDEYIDFIAEYNNKLIVSVGHTYNNANLYIYDYVFDTDGIVAGLNAFNMLPLSESRGFCYHVLNGILYVGSGTGDGNEYSEGMGANGGVIYKYNDGTVLNVDPYIEKVIEGLDNNVYCLTSSEGGSNLFAGTGPDGYVYEVDVINQAAFIVHNDTEDILSINSITLGENKFIFSGGSTNGIIRRSLVNVNSYDISFRTIPSRIYFLKKGNVSDGQGGDYTTIYAAVGSVVYYLSDSGNWLWRYTHSEDITDISFKDSNNTMYVISAGGITRVNPLTQTKTVYLKLIDRAGNETVIDTSLTISDNKFVDSIQISDLVDFVNENRIIELDKFGNVLWNLGGDNRFYSADKIEREKGVYFSEVFDGTNDLVKWESISWSATEFFNTQVLVYVRTSTSSNDILTANWTGPYYTYQSSGVDLSAMYGQYVQFKAELISTEKGVSPSFHRASIRAITSESIHFFTTNFVMPNRIRKGIITSQKIVPISADVVFGLNTTNSINWSDYQEVDENRLFNVDQTGLNLRVGIKLISPNRSLVEPASYDEYGPYNSNLYVNTVDFDFANNTGTTNDYHFRVSLYSDINLTNEVFSAYSSDSSDGFNVNGVMIPETGVEIDHGESVNILFTVPGSANTKCNTYYFVKVEYIYNTDFELISNDYSFVSSCTASFIDIIDFNFTNHSNLSEYYHFRIKFYEDLERTNEYKTVFSGNDRSGWFVDDVNIPENGILVASTESVDVVYRVDGDDFDTGKIYYLSIDAHDGDDYIFTSNSYTFQVKDIISTEYCGGYMDVPIINNFGVMIELDDNEFVTLNI